jgi:hypothetical protein
MVVLAFTIGFAMVSSADVPAPVVNQNLAIDDGTFNDLVEADCRFCHEGDAGIPVEGRCSDANTVCLEDADCPAGETCEITGIQDRHHLLALSDPPAAIPDPRSLIWNGTCSLDATRVCADDRDCAPFSGTCQAPLAHHPYAPVDPDRDNDGNRDTIYGCENCHPDDPGTPVIDFTVTRDCLECHVQISGEGSVHHIAGNSPAQENRCFVCHGNFVNLAPGYCSEGGGKTQGNCSLNTTTTCIEDGDCPVGEFCVIQINLCTADSDCPGANNTCGDGHIIPTYDPSSVTPKPSNGDGPPNPNSEIVFSGSCEYCHSTGNGICSVGSNSCTTHADCDTQNPSDVCIPDPGTPGTDTATGTKVWGNVITHHKTGVGLEGTFQCLWCHADTTGNFNFLDIRTCENCHGQDSLHNIQADSDGDGVIIPGIELPWFGHIGDPDDCWGCHGFGASSTAPDTGPLVPRINTSDVVVMTAGADKAVTLTGAAFENYNGTYLFTSQVKMTAADGSSVTLAPDSISESQIDVTIPGTTAVGSYALRVTKDDGTGTGGTIDSNPVIVTVNPIVAIADVSCSKKKGILTVSGTGFGEQPAGSEAYINAQVDGQSVEILSWSDTQIRASVASCTKNATTTVNAVMGSATNGGDRGGGGKGNKPCRGKKC